MSGDSVYDAQEFYDKISIEEFGLEYDELSDEEQLEVDEIAMSQILDSGTTAVSGGEALSEFLRSS